MSTEETENNETTDKLDTKMSMMRRYTTIFAILTFGFLVVIVKAGYIVIVEGDTWRYLGEKSQDSIEVIPSRGNIFDCNGQLIASSLPTYILHMDCGAGGLTSELLNHNIDSLSLCLSRLYGDHTPYYYRSLISQGRRNRDRNLCLNKRELSYTQYKLVKQFPLFREGKNKSGLVWDERIRREKPFGMLASRTIGNIYAEGQRGGNSGLELAFNDVLQGEPGIAIKEKIGGRMLKVNTKDAVNGMDITSTLDINIQDITESALNYWLKYADCECGCAVVMEVKTGEVKALANLRRMKDGSYSEQENIAMSALSEPGSTFKTVSVMVALDDGRADTSEIFDTGYGEWREKDWRMTDHNVVYNPDGSVSNKGGYKEISLAQAMWYSSNIGIAKMVDKYYGDTPWDFINHIYKMKLSEKVDMTIPGTGVPTIKNPDSKDWYGNSLLWMSYGYGIRIPPIYTLMFYNGIANGGKMIKPVFVKKISKNGYTQQQFETEVINESLCSKGTLRQINQMLEDVVNKGTARGFKSDNFQIAGKTGTAQTDYWKKDGKTAKKHQISFCGYFPANKPQYSCIVVVWHPNKRTVSPAGMTFKDIAERIYARSPNIELRLKAAEDSDVIKVPATLSGNRKALETVLDKLDIDYERISREEAPWVRTTANRTENRVDIKGMNLSHSYVPNVVGMGAKDAVYLLENNGLHVQISGSGKVAYQSIPAESLLRRGETIRLELR